MKDGNRLITSENIASEGALAGTENLVELKIDYYNELYEEFGTSQYISSDVLILTDGNSINDTWSQKEFFSTAPAGAVQAKLAIVFQQRGDAGNGTEPVLEHPRQPKFEFVVRGLITKSFFDRFIKT